jgi:S1-C subfamily serine protease
MERFGVSVAVLTASVLGGAALVLALAHGAKASPPPPRTGVAIVTTNLAYEGGAAAGTGIVLSSSGEVLTNNHVIRGATSVHVSYGGRTYSAKVLGYSVSRDVALLQLANAHGLKTAAIGSSSALRVGNGVTAVGNAGGTGVLTITTGKVTALGRGITVSDDQGDTNRLTGLVETNASLQPGDSGGPLLHAGRVVGMDAAASTGDQFQSSSQSYAIPIDTALGIAHQIESGQRSATVHVGPTAFLGVAISASGDYGSYEQGAVVGSVVPGSAADRAGLQSGDAITAIDGRTIGSATDLQRVLFTVAPGTALTIQWTDGYYTNSATVRPAAGPPQ